MSALQEGAARRGGSGSSAGPRGGNRAGARARGALRMQDAREGEGLRVGHFERARLAAGERGSARDVRSRARPQEAPLGARRGARAACGASRGSARALSELTSPLGCAAVLPFCKTQRSYWSRTSPHSPFVYAILPRFPSTFQARKSGNTRRAARAPRSVCAESHRSPHPLRGCTSCSEGASTDAPLFSAARNPRRPARPRRPTLRAPRLPPRASEAWRPRS
jgi:hypothetical protein